MTKVYDYSFHGSSTYDLGEVRIWEYKVLETYDNGAFEGRDEDGHRFRATLQDYYPSRQMAIDAAMRAVHQAEVDLLNDRRCIGAALERCREQQLRLNRMLPDYEGKSESIIENILMEAQERLAYEYQQFRMAQDDFFQLSMDYVGLVSDELANQRQTKE